MTAGTRKYVRLLALAGALVAAGAGRAGTDLNEVGALLVYPAIIAIPGQETFVSVTNAGGSAVVAHVSYINGDPRTIAQGGAGYCQECDFDLPLSGNDTETLVITSTSSGTAIQSEDSALSMSCPYPFGMLVVSLESGAGQVLTDNVLLGEEVVVDYGLGQAYSIPAIPFQGRNGGNGDHDFDFDDQEYAKLPRIVAASFIAPNHPAHPPALTAELVLFTVHFARQYPPVVDCSVVGYDADEHAFSSSFGFGCWTVADLCDVSPEFCYPNLGLYGNYDTHGWLLLNCRVDREADGAFDANGGVHGAMVHRAAAGAVARRGDPAAPALSAPAAWARLLHQSVTTGDRLSLELGSSGGGLD
jgi:hypothetical protein